jgi:hypothetical protein
MREILLNICLTAIALCLFKMLIPENSMKKQADFLVACFFLASMAFFFTNGRVNFNYNKEFLSENIPYVEFQEEYANAQKRAIERELHSSLSRVLAEEDIFPQEINISVHISDKYSISINEIRLVLVSEGDDESEEDLEALKKAIHIIQKEVGDGILITGELKNE